MAIDKRWRHDITLPTGYAVDSLPSGRSHTTGAGLFESSYQTTNEGRIVIEHRLRIERDRFAPEKYDGLRAILLEAMMTSRRSCPRASPAELKQRGVDDSTDSAQSPPIG